MQNSFSRFSIGIYELSRYWYRIAGNEMRRYGLKGSFSVYFTTLYRFPDGITAGQLCKLTGRDKADISRAMTVLQKQGLVERDANGKTYRALLKLTAEGRKLAEQVCKKADSVMGHVGQGLTDEDRAVFYKVLDRINDNLHQLDIDEL